MEKFTLQVTPCPKPRMVRSDRWKIAKGAARPCVARYLAFKDKIEYLYPHIKLSGRIWADFYLQIPKSYSKKKKAQLEGTPHQKRPDTDNLMKALKDAFEMEDSFVWDERGRKFWSENPRIVLRTYGD